MYADIPTIEKMLLPAIIVVVGFLVGVIFEKIILRKYDEAKGLLKKGIIRNLPLPKTVFSSTIIKQDKNG